MKQTAGVVAVGLALFVATGCDDESPPTDLGRSLDAAADRFTDSGPVDAGSDAPTQPDSADAWPDGGTTDQQSAEIGNGDAALEALTGTVNPLGGELIW